MVRDDDERRKKKEDADAGAVNDKMDVEIPESVYNSDRERIEQASLEVHRRGPKDCVDATDDGEVSNDAPLWGRGCIYAPASWFLQYLWAKPSSVTSTPSPFEAKILKRPQFPPRGRYSSSGVSIEQCLIG